MFSQNAPAESCYVSCGLSFPLSAPVSSQEFSCPQNMSYSLKLSGKPKPSNGWGCKVSTRWWWIFQSSKEAETSPNPSPVVAPEKELSLGRQGHKGLLPWERSNSALTWGEQRWGRGEGSPKLKRARSSSSRDGYFTQKCGTQKCSWARPLLLMQLGGQ